MTDAPPRTPPDPTGGPPSTSPPVWLLRALTLLTIVLAFVEALRSGWGLWGDLIVDIGRELWAPEQLRTGFALYRDVHYWYGPLAPYLNAVLYALLGTRVDSLVIGGIAVSLVMTVLSYRLLRLFAGRGVAALGAISVIYINLFGQMSTLNIFNFVLPYASAATYGSALSLASMYCLLHFERRGHRYLLIASCAFLALAALSKAELFFAVAASHVVYWAAAHRKLRDRLHQIVPLYALAAVLVIAVYGWFYHLAGFALINENLFLPGNLASYITKRAAGYEDVARNLTVMAGAGTSLLGFFGANWVLCWVQTMLHQAVGGAGLTVPLSTFGMAACASWIGYCLGEDLTPTRIFLPVPLFLALAMIRCGGRVFREGATPDVLGRLVLYTYALACLPRILLRCHVGTYGFFLLVPSVLIFVLTWCEDMPELLARGRSSRSWVPIAGGAGLVIAVGLTHARHTRTIREISHGPEPLRTQQAPRGTLAVPRWHRGSVDLAIQYLSSRSPATRVVAFPEGSALTFLAGCTNPLGIYTYMPIEFTDEASQAALIRKVEEAHPDLILRTRRPVPEYGPQVFGVDYGQALVSWISRHYRLEKDFRTEAYFVEIWSRVR